MIETRFLSELRVLLLWRAMSNPWNFTEKLKIRKRNFFSHKFSRATFSFQPLLSGIGTKTGNESVETELLNG